MPLLNATVVHKVADRVEIEARKCARILHLLCLCEALICLLHRTKKVNIDILLFVVRGGVFECVALQSNLTSLRVWYIAVGVGQDVTNPRTKRERNTNHCRVATAILALLASQVEHILRITELVVEVPHHTAVILRKDIVVGELCR